MKSESEARIIEIKALTSRLGVPAHDIAIFDRALTHASIASESAKATRDYESLEFLGDAVLGLAVAHHLFETLPDREPGEYSALRARLVNRRCVARVAKMLDIAPAIRMGKGEELSGGRQRSALMGDCLEALIGAVYIDSGWETAQKLIIRILQEELENIKDSKLGWDYKSRLQNYCQANRVPLPKFTVVRSDGPDHKKQFEVEVYIRELPTGRGGGTTKKEAEQNAAREALAAEGIVLQ